HKILTGRADQFDTLRQKDGLSGYTDRGESEHDWTESSHASAAISVIDGLSKAFCIKGESRRNAVAVVGDGALTGGMCWEALNNISANKERNAVIVVNDNAAAIHQLSVAYRKTSAEFAHSTVMTSLWSTARRPSSHSAGSAIGLLMHCVRSKKA